MSSPFAFAFPLGARVVEIDYVSVATCPILYYTASSSETEGMML